MDCAYWGQPNATDREHVIPKCLYPNSKSTSKVQRLTIPACHACNESWSEDEAHFRNVLLMSGEPNPPVIELWEGKVDRSFKKKDGKRRLSDLAQLMVPVEVDGVKRSMIYPGKDPKTMRVIRKIVRGLCYRQNLPVPREEQIAANIMSFAVPPMILQEMRFEHWEEDIVTYRYLATNDPHFSSFWLITFYERTPFWAIVSRHGDISKPSQASQ